MNQLEKPKKVCVFCGEKPESKTKEHIIPKWLIELTGDLNRTITLGISWNLLLTKNEFKEMRFSFNSFHFPACKKCNEDYGKLENEIKPIFIKILSEEYISVFELDKLLDWFDKIRVGLWLGFLYLEKGHIPITPKFHITRRIGDKDRSLVAYKISDNQKGIQFIGANLPCFSINPSCFALRINNYIFLNVSHDFIYAKNLGFPYPVNVHLTTNKKGFEFELKKGKGVINNKTFRVPFLHGGFEIYQPIIQNEAFALKKEYYINDFIEENTLNISPTHGSIFIKEGENIQKVEEDEDLLIVPEKIFDTDDFFEKFLKFMLNIQIHILNFSPLTNSAEYDSLIRNVIKGQKSLTKIKGLK